MTVRCCLFLLLLATCEPAFAQRSNVARQKEYRGEIQPLLRQFCYDCHGNGEAEGGLDFDKHPTARHVLTGRETWLKVVGKLRAKAMPPEGSEQPTDEQRMRLSTWIEETANDIDCVRDANPGRVTIRRLNRAEYRNTIRDLLLVDYEPADDFPADDVGYGFDNIGDVLSLPPILLEKYLDAAEQIVDRAIVADFSPRTIAEVNGERLKGSGRRYRNDGRILTTTGVAGLEIDFPRNGRYEIIATAFGHQAGPDPCKMSVLFDGKDIRTFDVEKEDESETFKVEGRATAGKHRVGLRFLNDFYNPKDPDPNNRDRNLILERLEVRGPLDFTRDDLPDSHRKILFVRPGGRVSDDEAARRVLERFIPRAYRRRLKPGEIDRLLQLVAVAREDGDSFEQQIQLAMQAVLVSPNFLFRVEDEPAQGQSERLLNEFELATRLSYFLWSTMPDDELLRLASTGDLRENLDKQIRRMLRHDKAQALVDNFAAQWLQLRKFSEVKVSSKHFPKFEELRSDMRRETEMFFAHIMRDDRPVTELLVADYTFANARLAKHYGIEGVIGDKLRLVSLGDMPRGGLLTQGSILTVTSNPTRTSPVKRGRWILENLLGTPPPAPPPDVPELEDEGRELTGTLRQRLEQHRADPSCAVCHEQMDGLGFALENFDAVGAWRSKDGDADIDARGELPDGTKFNGPAELARVLRESRRESFVRCLTEKMLTYALGRGLEFYDQCAVDTIRKDLAAGDERFSVLVSAIVRSEPFQKRGMKRSEP